VEDGFAKVKIPGGGRKPRASRGVHHTFVTTPGGHQWQVGRRNFITPAPPLFTH